MSNPDWYYDLLYAAAEAQELYSGNELEEYAKEWAETEEGRKWTKLVSTFEWEIKDNNDEQELAQ